MPQENEAIFEVVMKIRDKREVEPEEGEQYLVADCTVDTKNHPMGEIKDVQFQIIFHKKEVDGRYMVLLAHDQKSREFAKDEEFARSYMGPMGDKILDFYFYLDDKLENDEIAPEDFCSCAGCKKYLIPQEPYKAAFLGTFRYPHDKFPTVH